MATPRHLKNAPIKEALIDIRFKSAVTLDAIRNFSQSLKTQFSKIEDLKKFEGQLKLGMGEPFVQNANFGVIGTKLTDSENAQVLQATLESFTFSKLAPYDTKLSLIQEAESYWKKYEPIIKISSVSRVGVRFINSIEVPLNDGLNKYFTAPPIVPANGAPQTLQSYFSRMVTSPDPKIGAIAIITQAFEGVKPGLTPNVLLDIDIVLQQEIRDMNGLWALIKEMVLFEEVVFFSSITEETVKRYQ